MIRLLVKTLFSILQLIIFQYSVIQLQNLTNENQIILKSRLKKTAFRYELII